MLWVGHLAHAEVMRNSYMLLIRELYINYRAEHLTEGDYLGCL